jgi:hypothetical protein
MCIADFFEHGHKIDEIMNMDYNNEYLFILNAVNVKRCAESGKGGSRELRPVQRDAIKQAKDLRKG